MEKKRESGRLVGAGSAPGHTLGSQGGGGDGGELNFARGEAHRAYWTVECRRVSLVAEARELEVGRAGAQEDEAEGSWASTSRGDAASKQLRGGEDMRTALHALRPRGTGARDPLLFCFFANYSPNLN